MGRKRKYNFNEDYFSKIDSKEKAYWLGFIYADGYITKRKSGQNVFGLSLHEEEPLLKLTKCLESIKPIKSYKARGSYSKNSIEYKLAFISDKMVNDLEKHGVIERKTFTLKFPHFLNNELISHFIRGYFDGDGSVFIHKDSRLKYKKNTYLGITICGTESFLKDLVSYLPFLSKEDKCIYKDLRKLTDCFKIQFNSNIRCLFMYNYMYKECDNNYLLRKKLKFENYVNNKVQRL